MRGSALESRLARAAGAFVCAVALVLSAPDAASARRPGAQAPVRSAKPTDHRPPQPDALSGLLDSLLSSPALAGDQVGFILLDRDGKVRFSRNPDQRFVPASVRKLLVAAATVSRLGADATVSTRVQATGPLEGDRLEGDLVLSGGGDPSLDDGGLADLAMQVASAGVRVVTGAVLADASRFEPGEEYGMGWSLDDAPYAYATRVAALVVNRNAASGSQEVASPNPALHAAERFAAALGAAGVTVQGGFGMGSAPAGARPVADRTSPQLGTLLVRTNKESDNLHAEILLRHLAALATPDAGTQAGATRGPDASGAGAVPTVALGLAVEAEWLGWDRNSYRLVDGSGLSRYDLLTPRQVAEVLWRMRDHPAFVESLPVAGLDGTMAGRLAATRAQGRVRAKTGSMSGISTLAGYIGERWIFAFMVNGHVGPLAPIRAIQDAICLALTDTRTPAIEASTVSASPTR